MHGSRAGKIKLVRLAAAGCLLASVCGLLGGRINAPPAQTKTGAVRRTRPPSLSRLPPDVVRDYSYNAAHLLNGAGAPLYAADERYKTFLARLRRFPPDILIVGKEAPLTHSLGPTLSFGGENRTFPPPPGRKGEDARRLLLPDELRLRIKAT